MASPPPNHRRGPSTSRWSESRWRFSSSVRACWNRSRVAANPGRLRANWSDSVDATSGVSVPPERKATAWTNLDGTVPSVTSGRASAAASADLPDPARPTTATYRPSCDRATTSCSTGVGWSHAVRRWIVSAAAVPAQDGPTDLRAVDHVFREVEPLVSVVGRVLRLLVRAAVLDDPFNVLAAQVLSGYAIQPLPQARHESPGETPVVGGPVGCRCQHLEPKGALQLAHPVRGCRQRPDTREAGVDQDDQSVHRMQAVLLLDQLDELDAGVGVGRLDTVVRQEVEVTTGVGAVPDERQEQRGLLSRRRPERLLDRGLGLGDRRVDQQAPGSRVGAAPHLGVGHHRVQVHRRLGQERQGGRQARALRADNQDSPIAGDAHRGPLPWLSRSREHIIPFRDRDATGPSPGTARPGEGKRVITGRGKGSSLNSASLTPKPLASSVYVHALEAPSPLKRSISVRSSFPFSRPFFPLLRVRPSCECVAKRFAKDIPGW